MTGSWVRVLLVSWFLCWIFIKALCFVRNISFQRSPLLALFVSLPHLSRKTHSYSFPTSASWAHEVFFFFHVLMPCLFTFHSVLLTFKRPSGTGRLAYRGNQSQQAAGQEWPLTPSLLPAGPLSLGTQGPGGKLRHPTIAVTGSGDVLPSFRSSHAKPPRQLLWLFQKTMLPAYLGEEVGHDWAGWLVWMSSYSELSWLAADVKGSFSVICWDS